MEENNSKQEIKSKETKENKKPDIKIFVSHRIDMEAETIDNPLYVNVRCGAVFDKRENVEMLGDNTGDNISEKRESFCELTVQYWAWKNIDADYYGLCHYRRYLSFSGSTTNERSYAQLYKEHYLNNHSIEKYGLNDTQIINELLLNYDCVVQEPIDIRNILTIKGYAKNLYEYWNNIDTFMVKYKFIEMALSYLKQHYPKIYPYAVEYFDGYMYIGYNIYIMKKDIFFHYCSYLYDVLFYIEKQINKIDDITLYSETMLRSCGYIGEILFGIYILYLEKTKVSVKHLPLIYFEHTDKQRHLKPFSHINNIPIVVRISDYYTPYFAVLLQSIINNANTSNYYDIIVLANNISKDNKQNITYMLDGLDNISIRYINPEYLIDDASFYIPSSTCTRESYYTLFIPWLLPNYTKLLVIDSDLILQGDIAEIYNQDISDYLAGACKDIVFMGMLNLNRDDNILEYVKYDLKLKKPYNYVNTGILLLNTLNIRKQFEFNKMIQETSSVQYRILEQDLINILFEDQIKFIDNKYNHMAEVNIWVTENIANAPKKYNYINKQVHKNPFVIHYANQPKPWSNPNIPYSYKWWEIARKTPFYEIILQRMTYEQSNHISFTKLDHFSRIMFPFKWLKKVHKVGYIRQIADRLLPHGTKRRKIVKKLIFG